MNPELAVPTKSAAKRSLLVSELRQQLKAYFTGESQVIDQVCTEFFQFWASVHKQESRPDNSDSNSSHISSFEVFVEKLKAKLGDSKVLDFLRRMIVDDTHFRE
jgi:hypothetical protein